MPTSPLHHCSRTISLGALAFALMPLIFLLPKRRPNAPRIEIPAE